MVIQDGPFSPDVLPGTGFPVVLPFSDPTLGFDRPDGAAYPESTGFSQGLLACNDTFGSGFGDSSSSFDFLCLGLQNVNAAADATQSRFAREAETYRITRKKAGFKVASAAVNFGRIAEQQVLLPVAELEEKLYAQRHENLTYHAGDSTDQSFASRISGDVTLVNADGTAVSHSGVTDPHAAHLVGHQNILGIDKVDFVPVPKDDPASHDIPRTADVHSINSDGVKYDPTNVVPDGFYEKHTLFGHTYVDKSHVYSPDDWASTRAALQQLETDYQQKLQEQQEAADEASYSVWDSLPIISQCKSAIQAVEGDNAGAQKTQENFSKRCPVVSQVTSVVQVAQGNNAAAAETQVEFLKSECHNTDAVLGTHLQTAATKGLDGDTAGATEALVDSGRALYVDIASVAGEAIGGPLAGAALGVVAGYAFDGMHTACEAAATGQVHLYGDVKAADDMAHDSTGEKAVEWGADLGEKLTVGAVLGAGGGRFCAAVNNIDSGIVEGAEKAAVSNCNQTAAGSLEKNAVAGTAETEAAGGVVTAEPGSITAPQDLSQAPLAEMQNPVGNVDATLQDVSGNSIGMKADAMTPAPKSALEGLGNFAKEAAIESGIGLLFDVTKTEAMSGIHQKYDPQGVLKEAQDDFKESAHEESGLEGQGRMPSTVFLFKHWKHIYNSMQHSNLQ